MKKNLPFIIVGIVLIVVAFYGGMKYGQSIGAGNRRGMANLTPEQQQQMAQRLGNGFGARNGNNASNGEIIAKDNQSITIKLRDGGSKIIFFSTSTQISKSAEGTADDLEVGETVIVDGTANQDGSFVAQNIRINNKPLNQPPQ